MTSKSIAHVRDQKASYNSKQAEFSIMWHLILDFEVG